LLRSAEVKPLFYRFVQLFLLDFFFLFFSFFRANPLEGWSLELGGESSFQHPVQRMTTNFSSPSYTTMPRNRASLFATDSHSIRVHSVLASAILSDARSFHFLHNTDRLVVVVHIS